jgi:putative heme-binding domain-containing protein
MRRFAAAGTRADLLVCAKLFQLAPDSQSVTALTRGFEEAFKGRSLADVPDELIASLDRVGGGSLILDLRQGKPEAVTSALQVVGDATADLARRLEYIEVFGEVNQPECVPVLLELVIESDDDTLRIAALAALQSYSNPEIGQTVLSVYSNLTGDAQAVAQTLLASRALWTAQLLEAVEAKRIERESIPLDLVRRMTVHRTDGVPDTIRRLWGSVEGSTTEQMQQQIETLRLVAGQGVGDPYQGKKLFAESCSKCHVLFGEGGRVGPDLTVYQRNDLANMLLQLVNPSAEIREGFENYLVVTADGRAVTGFLAEQDNQVVVLRGADGQDVTVSRDEIDEMRAAPKSIMPESLLKDFSEQQVRDLLAYLRSTQPLNE